MTNSVIWLGEVFDPKLSLSIPARVVSFGKDVIVQVQDNDENWTVPYDDMIGANMVTEILSHALVRAHEEIKIALGIFEKFLEFSHFSSVGRSTCLVSRMSGVRFLQVAKEKQMKITNRQATQLARATLALEQAEALVKHSLAMILESRVGDQGDMHVRLNEASVHISKCKRTLQDFETAVSQD